MAELPALDGTHLAYDAFEPAHPQAVILWVGGWSDHRSRWRTACERLQEGGYAVYVLDQRGQGDSGGARGHLSRFSQLLGDLQAFRRVVRQRHEAPQVLLGHSFGGLVVLRYLETQPSDPVAAAILSSPWLGFAHPVPLPKRLLARVAADLWPTLKVRTPFAGAMLSRDPIVATAYDADPAVHHVMTPGAWREIQWALRVVTADSDRIECPLLFLLGGADQVVDAPRACAVAARLKGPVDVQWYPDMYHELLNDREADRVVGDVLRFLGRVSERRQGTPISESP